MSPALIPRRSPHNPFVPCDNPGCLSQMPPQTAQRQIHSCTMSSRYSPSSGTRTDSGYGGTICYLTGKDNAKSTKYIEHDIKKKF